MFFDRVRNWFGSSWSFLWIAWFFLIGILLYTVRGSIKLTELDGGMLTTASTYFNNLTPKFYVALTGTSSLVSGIILIFEWWYFKNNNVENASEDGSDNEDALETNKGITECKVWRNPMALLRGAEYNRVRASMNLEPLTFYDMNISSQDHQTFFGCDENTGKPEFELVNLAWRERDPWARINTAREALRINKYCAPALILLAEEACDTVAEAEDMFRLALKATEQSLNSNSRSLTSHEKFSADPFQKQGSRRRDLHMLMYIRRRLAMCARRQGRLRDAIKIFKEIIRDGSISNILGVQENLIEACLEMQAYADVQVLLVRYDGFDIREPRSAVMSYTSALLKARNVADKFVFDSANRRGLSSAEATAIEAITRAIEFNPHVPMYLLEMKPMILPPEHYLKRGDSEAIAYAFSHIQHWKRINGALELLRYTWKGDFASRFQLTGYCYPYSNHIEASDRELLPDWHELSVFPKKESSLWMVVQTILCLVACALSLFAYHFPANATDLVNNILLSIWLWISQMFDTAYRWFPDNFVGLLSGKPISSLREL